MIDWKDGVFTDGKQQWLSAKDLPRGVELTAKAQKVKELLRSKLRASYMQHSKFSVPAPEGLSYLPYQVAGIEYMVNQKNALLADDQGLGKTIQICGLINAVKPESVLIVCPASLKLNWKKELVEWLVEYKGIHLIEGWKGEVKTNRGVHIINYDILHKNKEVLLSVNWDMIVMDEAHMLKSREAKRTKAIMEVIQANPNARTIPMSGTPMSNRPFELLSLFEFIFFKYLPKFLRSEEAYGKYFCAGFKERVPVKRGHKVTYEDAWNYRGSSNLKELNALLRERFMLRRLKRDVLPQMPDRTVSVIDLNTDRKVKQVLKQVDGKMEQAVIDSLENGTRMPPMEGMSSVRKELALLKVKLAVEYATNILASGQKVIVFAHHIEVVDELMDALKGHGAVKVTGSTSQNDRHLNVGLFQNNPDYKVFVGNLQAAGVGLTLTASSQVVFVECSWQPAVNEQCIDRAHRIGQKNNVNAHFLVWGGTFDARILKTALAKQQNVDIVTK